VQSKLFLSIQKKFKPGELFFLSDIHDKSMTDAAVKEELLRLTKSGDLERYSYGVYYLPGDEEPSALKAIELRYIAKGNEIYGFYTGQNFLDGLKGKKPSLDDKIEIMTNRATSGKKNVYMFEKRFVLRKPYYPIDKYNQTTNAFLSYITMAPLSEIKRNYSLLANYARKEHLSANDVMEVSHFFPAKTASKLLSSDLYRSLWKH
jgi:hypothetical protein